MADAPSQQTIPDERGPGSSASALGETADGGRAADETVEALPPTDLGIGPAAGRRAPRAGIGADPEQIGPYRIIERIGEGGMGVVYKAEQRQPVRRLVALKVIKLGMDSREVVARFDVERQALALMSHPSVARVVDAGATESGRPYFAMEYVPGVPLDQYCDENRLTTRQRLDLFIPVCNAVQHAHQKGIIHRDLKPSNVLVTLVDGKPVPKVIDFGIAKATHTQLTQHTLYTQTGSLIGTPEYMSPEQAMTSGLDVDTRTDVYSLGVMLFELLTGTLPFDPQTLRRAGLEGMARIIRESEPPRPSTRLTGMPAATPRWQVRDQGAGEAGSGSGLLDTSAPLTPRPGPRADAKTVGREVRGDLDWITLKAMEKDRTRRYESAGALAADLQRYLDHEPVLARPPSTTYRLGKFVRKHRVGVAAGLAVAGALVLGLAGATIGFVQARHERDNAIAARREAEAQRRDADVARARAEKASADLDGANQFLGNLFMAFGNVPAAKERLAAAEKRLDEGWLADLPRTRIACRIALGYFFLAARNAKEAERQFTVALETGAQPDGVRSPHLTSAVYSALAELRQAAGDLPAAERYYREALAGFRQLPDGTDGVASTLQHLAEIREAQQDAAGARAMRMEGLNTRVAAASARIVADPKDAQAYFNRGQFRVRLGQFQEALPDYVRATELDPSGSFAWYVRAPLQLYLGDDAGYRAACDEMLRRFASSDQRQVGERAAKACLLAPQPVGDIKTLTVLADRAVAPGANPSLLPWFRMCKGMAEYRAGRYESAIDWLARARTLEAATGLATLDLFTAMAHHRLGHAADARQWLEQAVARMDTRVPRPGTDDLDSPENYLICAIVRREAEALIGRADHPPVGGSEKR